MDEDLAHWILPYSLRVVERRGLPPATAGVEDGAGGPGGAANGGGASGSGPSGGFSPPGPTSEPGHRYPRVGQGDLYHPPVSSSVTQVFTPTEIPVAALCTTSGELTDTAAHSLAHLFSVEADVVIGVPAGCMITSLLLTITSLGQNAATWAREHKMVGQPGVGALMVGLAAPASAAL